MVDTSVLVAGVAGLKDPSVPTTPSARFLHEWIEHDTFTWLVTRDILDEYTEVLARLGVRRAVIGRIVNLLQREAEFIETPRTVEAEPDPGDAPSPAATREVSSSAIDVNANDAERVSRGGRADPLQKLSRRRSGYRGVRSISCLPVAPSRGRSQGRSHFALPRTIRRPSLCRYHAVDSRAIRNEQRLAEMLRVVYSKHPIPKYG